MYTIAAYSESQDLAGVEGNVAAVPDQHMKVVGDQIFIGEYNLLLGAFCAGGTTATLLRLNSPSLRRVNPKIIKPLELAITPATNPWIPIDIYQQLPLDVNEGLEALLTADPAAAEQQTIIIFLADKAITPVSGKINTLRFSTTLVKTAGVWAFGEIVFDDELPVGVYSVVGARMVVANCVAFRFVPVGGMNRPGAICVSAVGYHSFDKFRYGNMGEWFKFNTIQPPGIELLASATAVSATYYGEIDVLV